MVTLIYLFIGRDQESWAQRQIYPALENNVCHQGCQMVYFYAKNRNLGKYRRALERKMLVYFMTIWNAYFTAIRCSLWSFGRFFPVFVCCKPRKIWQPCLPRHILTTEKKFFRFFFVFYYFRWICAGTSIRRRWKAEKSSLWSGLLPRAVKSRRNRSAIL
jgi:hypothetical protein